MKRPLAQVSVDEEHARRPLCEGDREIGGTSGFAFSSEAACD
jgi:hypothetical protein